MTNRPFYTPVSEPQSSFTLPSLQGTTLIVPAVSIGSVPQLAIDLLLHHPELKLVKVGRLDPSFCFPFVGPIDSLASNDDLTTALEVFSNGKLTVVQQRSPVFKSQDTAYIRSLVEWIHATNFNEVLWLSSIDAAARTDGEFSTPILSLFPSSPSSSSSGNVDDTRRKLPSTPLLSKVAASFPPFHPSSSSDAFSHDHRSQQQQLEEEGGRIPHIPGSLLTRKLLQHLSSPSSSSSTPTGQDNVEASAGKRTINLGSLLYFAAEGDTRQDAHLLTQITLQLLDFPSSSSQSSQSSFVQPPSWSALFGKPADSSLYA